jgi:ferredoxin-NADP reductase
VSSATKVTEQRAPTGEWRTATVREVTYPTGRSVVLRLDIPDRIDHWAGQHYVVRLTAEDGYVAQRSYSIASAPSDPLIELYVERLADGEVSSYLADIVEPGDELEIRGPIGGWFVWTGDAPAFGIGGGSGVVPIVAMLRHAIDIGQTDRLRIAVSARTFADLPYSEELTEAGALIGLSREDAATGRSAGRLSAAEIGSLIAADATCFVCGSAPFAEATTMVLLDGGVATELIRVERFGPSG